MSSTGTAPFSGVTVSIKNDLDVPVDIYDVFNPAQSGQTSPYLYTKLGTIGAGSSGTVTTIRLVSLIEAMYTGPVEDLQSKYYYQFPIKLMSGTQFDADNAPPLSYTIADADRQAMVQSFLFHKFVMANPDSALTKSLNDALKNKTAATFFAGTQNFKACTLGSWNAVMTWLNMFTSGWQGPYYLYEAAPSPAPAGYVPALVATLNIVSDVNSNAANLNLCSQASDGTLQPSSPAQRSTLAMVGDGTMADDNPGQDVTATLRPVWMNVIQTTSVDGKPQTSYIAGPTLTGTVAGTKVVSTQRLIPLPSQKKEPGGKSSGGGSSQTFSTICQVVGLIVGLVMLYEIAEKRLSSKQTTDEQSKSESKNQEDYDKNAEINDNQADNDIASTFNDNDGTIASDSSGVGEGYAEISTGQQKSVMTDTIQSERQSLNDSLNQELADGEAPTQPFEDAVQNTLNQFDTAQQQINDGKIEEASATLESASKSMKETLDQSQTEMQQDEIDALSDSVEAVNDATTSANELNEAQEAHEDETTSSENDSGAPTEEETPETEAIPEEVA